MTVIVHLNMVSGFYLLGLHVIGNVCNLHDSVSRDVMFLVFSALYITSFFGDVMFFMIMFYMHLGSCLSAIFLLT